MFRCNPTLINTAQSCSRQWDGWGCADCFYLFFTLKTHSDETPGSGGEGQGGGGEQNEGGGDSEGPEEPSLSLSGAIGMLTGITVIVAFASGALPASSELGLTEVLRGAPN